jgi:hypothetical protein
MKISKFVAVVFAAAIALGSVDSFGQQALPPPVAPGHVMGGTSPWWIFVCPTGIVTAAVVKNAKRHKELTRPEAWTCGFLYWWNEGTGKYGR